MDAFRQPVQSFGVFTPRASRFTLIGGVAFVFVFAVLRVVSALRLHWSRRLKSFNSAAASFWQYRAEGALNLVVAYCGSDETYLSKVLRLRKRQVGSASARSSCEAAAAFSETLRPFMSGEFVPHAELVKLEPSFLQAIHWQCQSQRPSHRLETEIDTSATHGLLLPDLTDLPFLPRYDRPTVLSCEIKPKAGVLPSAHTVCAEHKIKSQVARFTMMQHTKLKSGKVKSISKYNPLDLFSNNTERMRAAVRRLAETPQNNFVLRSLQADGQSLNITHPPERETIIANCLSVDADSAVSTLAELLVLILQDCQVLREIEKVQAIDRFDIENVYWMHSHLRSPRSVSEEDARSQAPAELPAVEEWPGIVREFLMAQSARDCSVLVTFAVLDAAAAAEHQAQCRLVQGCCVVEGASMGGRRVVYRCGLVDLDEKPESKIDGYWEQDRGIVQEYLRAVAAEKLI